MKASFASAYVLAGIILTAAALEAQQTVRVTGRVFDETLSGPAGVASVQVLLVAVKDTTVRITALSDRRGQFVVDRLVPGRYRVRMSRIGYTRMQWERNFDGAEDSLSVVMQESNSADYTCPSDTVLEPHFLVTVRDQDAQPVTNGVIIIARSDAEVDTLRLFNGAYRASPSREGTYVLEVTGPGFHPSRISPIVVRKVVYPPRALCGIPIPRLLFVERSGVRLR
jgi:hypothetical protein